MFGFIVFITTFIANFKERYKDAREKQRRKSAKLHNKLRNRGKDPTTPTPLKGSGDPSTLSTTPELDAPVDGREGFTDVFIKGFLYLISMVIAFFETLIVFLLVAKLAMILFIGAIVVVIVFAFLALISTSVTDKNILDGGVEGGGGACYNSMTGGKLQWTDEELSAKGATLTANQKNIYKLGILYKKAYESEQGKTLKHISKIDPHNRLLFSLGISSIESSFNLGSGDIYTDPTGVSLNGSGYGALGISGKDTLKGYFATSGETAIKAQWKPSKNPSYEADYLPWGVYLSGWMQDSKVATVYRYDTSPAVKGTLDELLDRVAKEWGISANKSEFSSTSKLFLMQAQYHGAKYSQYEAYVNFWAAMFALSSEDDSKRSFSNWSIATKPGKTPTYAESAPNRYMYIGKIDHRSMRNKATPSDLPAVPTNVTNYIAVNGVAIERSLWKYVYEEGSKINQTGINKSWNFIKTGTSSTPDWALNFHYGLNSYLQAVRIENDLATKMGVSGETQTEIICEESQGGKPDDSKPRPPLTPGKFKATPGVGQATINGMTTKQYMEEYYKKASAGKTKYLKSLEKHWGHSSHLEDPNRDSVTKGYVDKLHGVPHYGQYTKANEVYGQSPYVPGGNTYYISACMIYSYAYAASAMLGVLINPAEMGSILHANNAFSGNLIYTGKLPSVMKQLGLNGKDVLNGKSWAGFDETLDKGGVVVIRTLPGPEKFTGTQHFQVITGKEVKSGVTYYSMYTSSSVKQSMTLYTKEQLLRNMHRNALLVWK